MRNATIGAHFKLLNVVSGQNLEVIKLIKLALSLLKSWGHICAHRGKTYNRLLIRISQKTSFYG